MRSIRSSLVERPPSGDLLQGIGVDVVEFEAPVASDLHEAGRFEHLQVLRDPLARRAEAVLHREPRAQLEEGLAIAFDELVEDRSPRRIGERLEHVAHARNDRQAYTCLSTCWTPLETHA